MHTGLTTNGVLKDFLKNGESLTYCCEVPIMEYCIPGFPNNSKLSSVATVRLR